MPVSSAQHKRARLRLRHLAAGRFLGLGNPRERERQHIREAERGTPSLLTLHESASPANTPPTTTPSPVPQPTKRARQHRTRSERHFSASTPPSSSEHSSSSHGAGNDTLQLARMPSRLGADGPLATWLSGWFVHLAGSTSNLSLTGTISHATQLALSASSPTAIRASTSRKAKAHLAPRRAAPGLGARVRGAGGCGGEHTSSGHHTHHHLPTLGHSTARHAASTSILQFHLHFTLDLAPHSRGRRRRRHRHLRPLDARRWPVAFHAQVWCTYRAGFEPIRDLPGLGALPAVGRDVGLGFQRGALEHILPPPHAYSTSTPHSHSSTTSTSTSSSGGTKQKRWSLPSLGVGGTKGWTSDAGFGCMLRMGRVWWRVVAGADALET
ncbi:hypothetical protein DFH09DRAFT_1312282 [Mycena vulgaris]|nr:hypothetical protein DFH09DRAFT_1312282 [Mycena vulgaris]